METPVNQLSINIAKKNSLSARLTWALCIAFILPALHIPARAQSTFGSITGSVTDPSGGAVPGAKVTIINPVTGSQQQVTTDAAGAFNAADIQPGTYDVVVDAKGFTTQRRTGIVVYAHNVVNVDTRLAVGDTKTSVEVTEAAPVIDTSTQTLSYTQTSAQLSQAPTNATLQDTNQYFALYSPGVGINSGGGIHAFGLRTVDTRIANDGIIEMADADGVGGGPIGPAPGSVAEVTTVTNGANAEYQEPANVIIVTKSGGNTFHGLAAFSWNGSDLNARNFFSSSVPFANFDDYNANVGGPIKKNKLFFFANYEGLRSRGQSVLNANVPLAAWRTGNFSGQTAAVVNPFNKTPFPGNQIPSSLISPVAIATQNLFYPVPNFGPSTLQSGNWRALLPSTSSSDTGDGRIDYNISDRDRVFGRMTYHANNSDSVNGGSLPAAIYLVNRPTTSAFISYTHVFSTSLVNEFRTGVSRNNEVEGPALIASQVIGQIGLQGVNPPAGLPGQPVFNVTGLSNTDAHSGYTHNLDTNFQWVDNVSWTKGSHFLKFGLDAIRDQLSGYSNSNNVNGTLNFTGTYSGSAYADFLIGIPQTTSVNILPPFPYLRATDLAFYAQDQYKVSKRLTLNYGLRYELDNPYHDKNGSIYSFDPTNLSIVVPQNGLNHISPDFPKTIPVIGAQQAGYPADTLLELRKKNFYPRLGVAYQLTSDGKTVLRSGYGLYSSTIYPLVIQKGGPFAGSETFTNSITNGVAALSFPNPFTTGGAPGSFQTVTAANPNLRVPYTQQWNFTLERQIGQFGVSIGYLGSHGTNLPYERNLNQPEPSTIKFTSSRYLLSPAFSSITWIENGANEEYNGLQLAVTKTVGKNLTLNAGYNWARDLTPINDVAAVIPNQFCLSCERGNNTYTPTQHFVGMVVYALPVGKEQHYLSNLNRGWNEVIGGWRLSAIETAQSGIWFTPSFTGFDTSNTNTIGGRPSVVPGMPLYPSNQSITQWFNPAAFYIPGCPTTTPVCSSPADVGAFGNAAPYQLAGPKLVNLDLALLKDFHVTESKMFQFEIMANDAFNQVHFGLPAANISSPATVGQITSTIGSNYVRGSADSRTVYLLLKFLF